MEVEEGGRKAIEEIEEVVRMDDSDDGKSTVEEEGEPRGASKTLLDNCTLRRTSLLFLPAPSMTVSGIKAPAYLASK